MEEGVKMSWGRLEEEDGQAHFRDQRKENFVETSNPSRYVCHLLPWATLYIVYCLSFLTELCLAMWAFENWSDFRREARNKRRGEETRWSGHRGDRTLVYDIHNEAPLCVQVLIVAVIVLVLALVIVVGSSSSSSSISMLIITVNSRGRKEGEVGVDPGRVVIQSWAVAHKLPHILVMGLRIAFSYVRSTAMHFYHHPVIDPQSIIIFLSFIFCHIQRETIEIFDIYIHHIRCIN